MDLDKRMTDLEQNDIKANNIVIELKTRQRAIEDNTKWTRDKIGDMFKINDKKANTSTIITGIVLIISVFISIMSWGYYVYADDKADQDKDIKTIQEDISTIETDVAVLKNDVQFIKDSQQIIIQKLDYKIKESNDAKDIIEQ